MAMQWLALVAMVFILGGCQTWQPKVDVLPAATLLGQGRAISLEDYLIKQRELNETYLYGSPAQALKSLEQIAQLEEDYARNGQRPIDSDHARMLVYSRLFVMSERMRQRPEAEGYLEKALSFAKKWQPKVGGLSDEAQVGFVRNYVDQFENGLEVRWKAELK